MKHAAQLITILIFLSSFAASEEPCASGTIDYVNGIWYQSDIYPKELVASPAWDPSREPHPPLAAGKAIELATAKLAELFPLAND